MNDYIEKLRTFLDPHMVYADDGIIKLWLDHDLYFFLDFHQAPYAFGENRNGKNFLIQEFDDLCDAQRQTALSFKGLVQEHDLRTSKHLELDEYRYAVKNMQEYEKLFNEQVTCDEFCELYGLDKPRKD